MSMPVALHVILVAMVPVAILAAVHYYLYARLIRDLGLPRRWRIRLSVTLLFFALWIPTAIIVARVVPSTWRTLLAWPGYVWLGTMFLLLLLVACGDAIRVAAALWYRMTVPAGKVEPARRLYLARVLGAGALGTSASLLPVALASAARPPRIEQIQVPLRRLPKGLDRLVIAQISDLHVGEMARRTFVEDIVRCTNALAPDLVVITGDLVDGSVADLAHDVAPIAQLQARYGTFFVTGNHEYFSGVDEWVAHLTSLGIRVLRNERVTIGEGEAVLELAGVDDHGSHAPIDDGPGGDIRRALAGADPRRELVLLAHQPKDVVPAAELGAGLVLSGHTHGGQIWPFGALVRLTQPYVAGLHLHDGKTWIYVSRGTGCWGPPMRLGNPAEITRVELRCTSIFEEEQGQRGRFTSNTGQRAEAPDDPGIA
jgi:predicted MPP superfamily phosphohydrolase